MQPSPADAALAPAQPQTAWARRNEPAARLRASRHTDWGILAVCLGVVLLAAMLRVNPTADGVVLGGIQLPEVCGAKKAGIPCPGCGLTRSFVLGVRLDPAAFRLHRLGPLLLLLVVAQVPYRAWRLWRVRRPEDLPPPAPPTFLGTWAFPALITAFVLNWAVSMAQQFLLHTGG